MGATKTRSAVFFIQYLILLLAALVWVQFDFVRRRIGDHLGLFYLLIGAAGCYLAIRAFLVLKKEIPKKWSSLWLSLDLAIITSGVYLTGGINSEAGLLYFWPIATSSIQRLPRRTMAVSAASSILYVVATWQNHGSEKYLGSLLVRMVFLLLVSSLAIYYSLTEAALIEELVRLRESVALADYRQRLSREMHDGIQHYLAGIAMRLELARSLMKTDPVKAAHLAVEQRLALRLAAAELRYLVRLLRSPAVEREGFVDALRHHLSSLTDHSSMSVALEVEGEVRPLSSEVAQTALRIAQEAIMNVERHAQTKAVKVVLCFAVGEFRCTIKDNGIGFNPSSLAAPGIEGGFGLPGMKERAESVGGKLHIASTPGQGTEIVFTVPVENHSGVAAKGA